MARQQEKLPLLHYIAIVYDKNFIFNNDDAKYGHKLFIVMKLNTVYVVTYNTHHSIFLHGTIMK